MLNRLTSDDVLLTLRGREYVKDFTFQLESGAKSVQYDVQGVQIEVDGGYEGKNDLSIFEAKMGLPANTEDDGMKPNMNLRQLLYPELHYKQMVSKPVKTYVMFYGLGGFFYFLPFCYGSGTASFDYQGYRLFKLEQEAVVDPKRLLEVKIDLHQTGFGAPFPQADSFERVYEIFLKVAEMQNIEKEDLFLNYNLVGRQHGYYLNVLIWLGLVRRDEGRVVLTELGEEITTYPEKLQVFKIAEIAFSNGIFNAFLNTDKPEISETLRQVNGLTTESTFKRRMKTVISWKKFFFNYLKEK
jgi:hypothetical protein